MSSIVVMKFGSSVLADKTQLAGVSDEIYRALRDGFRVVAVVSALGDTTDELVEAFGEPTLSPEAYATYISTGELQSAALLTFVVDSPTFWSVDAMMLKFRISQGQDGHMPSCFECIIWRRARTVPRVLDSVEPRWKTAISIEIVPSPEQPIPIRLKEPERSVRS